MNKRSGSPVQFMQFFLLLLSVATLLTACSKRADTLLSSDATEQPNKGPSYNALIAALPPLTPKSELENSEEFSERKRKRLAHLVGVRLLISIPVGLGKCNVPEKTEMVGRREYVGLRYDADLEQLEVCALDASAITPSAAGRSYGMLITESDSTMESSIGTNLMGAKVEITERTVKGKGIFVDLPTSSVRDFAHAKVSMKLPVAKDLLASGGRLVYEVILDPDSSGDLMESSIKTRANMSEREGLDENIIGVVARVLSIALENSAGARIARFELPIEDDSKPRLALIPDPNYLIGDSEGWITRYGVLRIGDAGAYLDGKKVFRLGLGGDLKVIVLRQLGEHDVVVTEENSGGSAGYVSMVLLDIGPDQAVTVFREESPGLHGFRDPTLDIRKNGNTLVFDLGFEDGKHRTAIFNGKTLSTRLQVSGPTPIPDGLCRLVHAVVEKCAERQGTSDNCDNTFGKLSNAETGGIYDAFAYPAKIEYRFKQACDAACNNGRAPKFSQTQDDLCNASMP